MQIELKPCPFCGCKDFLKVEPYQFPPDEEGGAWQWGYNVLCDASGFEGTPRGCGASSPWQEEPGDAVDAWNRRALTSATPPDVADSEEEARIDNLRLRAFQTNADQDRQAYFDAASKWFQDRHFRRTEAATALRLSAGGGWGKPAAWLAEGYGYQRVFIEREAAEKMARGGTLTPLYALPASPTVEAGR